ncbi:hypothetical protein HMPREF9418_2153 [Neisseria macacae ATCC 33926]|uniref:Uncharacterized protein n=1 Tax=Neisseria macacae ATCC 33926 TaxID=997348 RepID=A0AA36UHT6_9NEIS|nr:hypothetical protein HMPREF9418_2153 [Neisseria macacae ATCC 33926]
MYDRKVLKRPNGRLKVFRRPFYLPRQSLHVFKPPLAELT